MQILKLRRDRLMELFSKERSLFRLVIHVFYFFFLFGLFSQLGAGERVKLMVNLSDQDVILPISSIEWGIPDRWSITTRYTHMFEKDRDGKPWLNNLCITISPGISGGRIAIGYLGIFSPTSIPDLTILSEARLALLRTWGNPHSIDADLTFAGVEIRSSLRGIINLGIGYYIQISFSNGDQEQFFGFHAGIGI